MVSSLKCPQIYTNVFSNEPWWIRSPLAKAKLTQLQHAISHRYQTSSIFPLQLCNFPYCPYTLPLPDRKLIVCQQSQREPFWKRGCTLHCFQGSNTTFWNNDLLQEHNVLSHPWVWRSSSLYHYKGWSSLLLWELMSFSLVRWADGWGNRLPGSWAPCTQFYTWQKPYNQRSRENQQEAHQALTGITHLEGGLSRQTLVNDGSYTPEVSFGVIVLRHNDFRCLHWERRALFIRTWPSSWQPQEKQKPLICLHFLKALAKIWQKERLKKIYQAVIILAGRWFHNSNLGNGGRVLFQVARNSNPFCLV